MLSLFLGRQFRLCGGSVAVFVTQGYRRKILRLYNKIKKTATVACGSAPSIRGGFNHQGLNTNSRG